MATASDACAALRLDQFPALADKVFLDAACASLAPRAAADAIGRLVADIQACPARSSTAFHIELDRARDAARPEAARLINGAPADLALVENTSAGLTLASRAIPLQAGDNILVADLEYLQVPLAWRQGPADRGPEIRLVRHVDGTLPIEAFEAAADARTRLVVVSSVQWSNGFRVDLAGLSAFCRRRGIWLVVDAIQQLGAFPIDVAATPVDILVCGGHKWLNAPFGAGFMYVDPAARDRLRPPRAGYLSVNPPDGGWGEYFRTPGITPVQPVTFTDEARVFETGGTGNYPGAVGLAASLRLLNDLGAGTIEAHIRSLTDALIEGLDSLPVRLVTPRAPACRSGIVTFGLASVAHEAALIEHLLDRRILVSHRYTSGVGGVRVSCHVFNTHDDVGRLLEETRGWLRGATGASPAP